MTIMRVVANRVLFCGRRIFKLRIDATGSDRLRQSRWETSGGAVLSCVLILHYALPDSKNYQLCLDNNTPSRLEDNTPSRLVLTVPAGLPACDRGHD